MEKKYLSRVKIGRVEIDNLTQKDVLNKIEEFVYSGSSHYIVTPNTDHIVKLEKDDEFLEIYRQADLVLADGMPLIWASIFLGTPIKMRVTGSDLFPEVCRMSAEKGYKVFFLGGRPGAAEGAKKILEETFEDLKVVGTYAPPYGFEYNEEENLKITNIIKKALPDILFVGLGAPKQERWIFNNKLTLNVPVSIGIGVSFEFVAGMVKRAPLSLQKAGLEWFWRFIMEPRRLWRRYFIDDLKIFRLVLRQKAALKKND